MTTMHKLIIIILTLLLSVSTCQKKIDNTINEQTMIEYADTLNRDQLHSLFVSDTLSIDIENDWIKSQVVSDNKSDFLYKYVYIKSLTDSTGIIYTLCTYQDTLYIINKRIVE